MQPEGKNVVRKTSDFFWVHPKKLPSPTAGSKASLPPTTRNSPLNIFPPNAKKSPF